MTADELRRRREAAGLSMGALARVAGVNVSTVSRWEAGLTPISKQMAFWVEGILIGRERDAARAERRARKEAEHG